ncbi:MAG: hypothetical protein GZ086_09175 [Gelidibacter sp.]|nr:hypothetical protein [Gelidibacter sp.]
MKISKLLFAIAIVSIFTMTSCKDTKSNSETTEEHGHEHDADGNHMNDETVEQEEFTVEKDSLQIKEESHTHDSGHNHQSH